MITNSYLYIYIVTRYDPNRAAKDECLSLQDIEELLGLDLIGVIPESKAVLTSTNIGQPVILGDDKASIAYKDMVQRFLGNKIPMKFVEPETPGFFSRLFGNQS
jgi:septum site-determining protein MinD